MIVVVEKQKAHLYFFHTAATTSAFQFPTRSCESAYGREDVALF